MVRSRRPIDALGRAQKRAIAWNILTVLFGFACVFVVSYLIGREVILSQYIFSSTGTFYCRPTIFAGVAILFISFIVALPAGLLIASIILWLVTPIRRALNVANERANLTFNRAMKQLLPWGMLCMLVGVPVMLLTVNRNICFADETITYRPSALSQARKYEFDEIKTVQAGCSASKGGWGIGIIIQMNDGLKIDINREDIWQRMPFERIVSLLAEAPFDNSGIMPGCPPDLRALLRPK